MLVDHFYINFAEMPVEVLHPFKKIKYFIF